MKRSILLQAKLIKWLIVSMILACSQIETMAQTNSPFHSKTTFTVKTYDGLELPAQLMESSKPSNRLLLLVNGSTPYDEKGNQWAGWNGKGNIIL